MRHADRLPSRLLASLCRARLGGLAASSHFVLVESCRVASLRSRSPPRQSRHARPASVVCSTSAFTRPLCYLNINKKLNKTMARSVAACLVVLLAVFEIGSCIKCYQCNTQNDKNCMDPIKSGSQAIIDCNAPDSVEYNKKFLYAVLPAEVFGSVIGAPRYCHKITMETGTIIRTCLDGNPGDINHTCRTMEMNSKLSTADKRIKSCTVCDKDNCNAASSVSFSLPLALAALLSAFMLYKQ